MFVKCKVEETLYFILFFISHFSNIYIYSIIWPLITFKFSNVSLSFTILECGIYIFLTNSLSMFFISTIVLLCPFQTFSFFIFHLLSHTFLTTTFELPLLFFYFCPSLPTLLHILLQPNGETLSLGL